MRDKQICQRPEQQINSPEIKSEQEGSVAGPTGNDGHGCRAPGETAAVLWLQLLVVSEAVSHVPHMNSGGRAGGKLLS